MKRPILSLFLAVTVVLTPVQAHAEPAPEELTPEARADWAAAMAAYERGDLRAAIAGALEVFAAYPDPVAHREIRHKIAGPLSFLWDSLYEQTQLRADVCAWRSFVYDYRQAFGREIRERDAEFVRHKYAQIDGYLARDHPANPTCEGTASPGAATNEARTPGASPAPPTAPAIRSTAPRTPTTATLPGPVAAPRSDHDPRRATVGKALIGAGAVMLLGAAVSGIVYADRYARISSLTRTLADAGRPSTPDEDRSVRAFERQGLIAAGFGITSGVLGGAALVVGLATLLTDRPTGARRVSVTPHAAPGRWGLQLAASF